MRIYRLYLNDEKYCMLFKYSGMPSDLLKQLKETKFIVIGRFIINKDRIKEIKDISIEEGEDIEKMKEIIFEPNSYYCHSHMQNITMRENADIDMIAK